MLCELVGKTYSHKIIGTDNGLRKILRISQESIGTVPSAIIPEIPVEDTVLTDIDAVLGHRIHIGFKSLSCVGMPALATEESHVGQAVLTYKMLDYELKGRIMSEFDRREILVCLIHKEHFALEAG